jgi:hypothetical protein
MRDLNIPAGKNRSSGNTETVEPELRELFMLQPTNQFYYKSHA